MTQHFTTDDALYGLRNLAVGDDEQTRIADDYDILTPDARALLDLDTPDYDAAYKLMIVPALAHLTREQVEDAADVWAIAFCSPDCDDDTNDDAERPEDLVADMMNVYDELHAR